jgi:hypothetical protein
MTTKTRYFVLTSLLVLTVGLATGLVAYYVGFPTSARSSAGGPEELQYVPSDAAVLAYANVQDVMNSDLRRRLKAIMPISENGQQEFQTRTGINIETDIDRVVAVLGGSTGVNRPDSGMVVATGRFDDTKIESLMREHGADVEEYKSKRLLIVVERADPAENRSEHTMALAFLKPGVIAVGSSELVHRAVDLEAGGDNITTNDEVMELVRSLDSGNNAWALGHFDALQPKAKLPDSVASQIPAINMFSVSAHINGGVQGMLRAETRDDEAAKNLREVVNGVLALGKLQTGGKPEMQAMMQSLQVTGSGNTVAVSFSVPAELFELLGSHVQQRLVPEENR